MILVDVHTHLDIFPENEIKEVIERARKAGVVAIINNGVNKDTNRKTLELAKKIPIVKPALGIYPTEISKISEQELNEEIEFIKKNIGKISAIGEVGLDYLKSDNKEAQKEVFRTQVEIAIKGSKPVIVHSRKAESDVIDELISSGAKKVVMHCCMAPMKQIKRAADAGFSFSIPSLLVRSSHFQKVVEILPTGQLLTETDAPFLSPIVGGSSEPAMVMQTIEKIAEIKRVTSEDAANLVFMNYQRSFS